jgi:hypothetical protein
MESAYRNIGYFLLALPLIFVAGFWIPYLSEIPRFDPSITAPVHLHALLLFAWVVLLVVQPLAIRSGAFPLHRILGRISYALMPLIVVSAVAMIHKEYHEHLADGTRSGPAARCGVSIHLPAFTAWDILLLGDSPHKKAGSGGAHALHDLHRSYIATLRSRSNVRLLVRRKTVLVSDLLPDNNRPMSDRSDLLRPESAFGGPAVYSGAVRVHYY